MMDWDEELINGSDEGNLNKVKLALENYAEINVMNWAGNPIGLAAEKGHLAVVKYLLEEGADLTVNCNYALKYAAYNGHLEVINELLKYGADATAEGGIAIMYASTNRKVEALALLLNDLIKKHKQDIANYIKVLKEEDQPLLRKLLLTHKENNEDGLNDSELSL